MIFGIDAGNYKVKARWQGGVGDFLSDIGEYRDVNLKQAHGPDDMIFEYDGRMGFAGSLAKYESEFCGSIMGDSKAHEDAKLRILLALHRFGGSAVNFDIVVGQPIKKHNDTEKALIKKMLTGKHELTVNGERKVFIINRVEIAAEGASAFWCKPGPGKRRIIDPGSGTVNCATLFGTETSKTNDPDSLARAVAAAMSKKWSIARDPIDLIGGKAEELEEPFKKYFPNLQVMRPLVNIDGTLRPVHPVYCNASAFFEIAKRVFT
jgi:plasmid segregation protein ParM